MTKTLVSCASVLIAVSVCFQVAVAADKKASARRKAEKKKIEGPVDDLLKPKPREPRPPLAASKLPLEFIKSERIAFVGGSLAERMNLFGNFETLLHWRFPQHELVIRNFARPADEVAVRQRPNDYTKLDDPLFAFGPDTFFCFFGYNESFAGPGGVEKFKEDYEKFIDEYKKTYLRDDSGASPRFVLISPVAFEPTGDPFLPDGARENANLGLYAAAVAEVANKRRFAFVDLFTPTQPFFRQKPGMQFTINGCHLNEEGDREVSELLDRALFNSSNPAKVGSRKFEKVRATVNEKSWVHLQDYRMINGWYVYGGRRTFDTETFPREYLKIRDMAAVRDGSIWDIVQGNPVPPQLDDSATTELYTPPTLFGSKPYSEPKELRFLTPEECMATMKVPDGFEVNLFASEREFPEVANVVQLNFDNKGRLWCAAMPTYPMWKPGDAKPADRLLIFEDKNGDGKADKCKVFYDKLTCPTGFEFWNGGVLVTDQPRMLFLKDTNGDDVADVVVHLSDGWATDDTHHSIGAFEWSHGGLLHMLEGVAMSTTVETPVGPFRNHGSPGTYVLDPRTAKIRHFVTPGYGNPWCYVFNEWGQGIVGDGTTAQQHWDSPLSTERFGGRRGLNTIFDSEGMRPVVGSEFLLTRQFPDEVQGQFIYACVINMNGLTRFEVHDNGAGYGGSRLKKTGKGPDGKEKNAPNDLLTSTDKNFRPTDPQIGPDGALYFGDWSNPLIGHMQYSQRDPNRDHTHGRIYRLSYKNKPLLKPVTQYRKSIPQLLDQLKEYEPRTRYRARRELRDRPTDDVLAAIKTWINKLDPGDKQYDRFLCEALWVQQGHHSVETDLLKKVLRAGTGEARAAATRVLADEWDRVPQALELVRAQVTDEFPRTRLEAIRALSFVRSQEAAELALEAVRKPRDYWIDYTLEMTIGALEPYWKPAFDQNKFAVNNLDGIEFVNRYELANRPSEVAGRHIKGLVNGETKKRDRENSYNVLAGMSGNAENGKAIAGRVCIACHKVGDQGIEYGPELTKVGDRLKKQELIESIIEPNAKLDPLYLTTNIETADGEAFTGFILGETGQALTLRIAGGVAKTFEKTQIRKRETIKQSSMPEGLASGISPAELLDLVAYLSSLK